MMEEVTLQALQAQLESGGKCECGEKDVCRIVARRLEAEQIAKKLSMHLEGLLINLELGYMPTRPELSEAREALKGWREYGRAGK
jgi:hypothetical protein